MHQRRLSSQYERFIVDLKKIGMSNTDIAEKLGITEGAVRYRIKRNESGKRDGRKNKLSRLQSYRQFIDRWIEDYKHNTHRPTLKALYHILKEYHMYQGSYDALRRYIRKYFPAYLKKGARIRIETPPGILMQVDWKEDIPIQLNEPGNWVKINALCFSLSFSRKMIVRISTKKDIQSFISCHQDAFRKYGGLPQYIRPDCLRSAIVRWKGEQSILNERYKRYMHELGIKVFPSRPGTPTDKGKIEKRIGDMFRRIAIKERIFKDLIDFQRYIDSKLSELEKEWTCGATGLSIRESFNYERRFLVPLPELFPMLPVKELRTLVRRDGLVYFDGSYYQVPLIYVDRSVLCLHTGQEIQIYYDGEQVECYSYLPGVKGMVRLSGNALRDDRVFMSDRVRNWALEVASRQVNIYHEISRGLVR